MNLLKTWVGRWCRKYNISLEVTAPYAHHMNGVAERNIRTVRRKGSLYDTRYYDLWPDKQDHQPRVTNYSEAPVYLRISGRKLS